jgi:hypothetical protein
MMCQENTDGRGKCGTLGQLFGDIEKRLDRIEALLEQVVENQETDVAPLNGELRDFLLEDDEADAIDFDGQPYR